MAVFEAVGRGSIPRRGTDQWHLGDSLPRVTRRRFSRRLRSLLSGFASGRREVEAGGVGSPGVRHRGGKPGCRPVREVGPWSVREARDRAKVEGQVRLLAGTCVFDAETTWRGGGLQSHLERVRIPSASLCKQAPGESRSPAAARPPSRFGRVCSEHGVYDGSPGGTTRLAGSLSQKSCPRVRLPSLKVVAQTTPQPEGDGRLRNRPGRWFATARAACPSTLRNADTAGTLFRSDHGAGHVEGVVGSPAIEHVAQPVTRLKQHPAQALPRATPGDSRSLRLLKALVPEPSSARA